MFEIWGLIACPLVADPYHMLFVFQVGYGRGTPTNSLWCGGLSTEITDHELMKAFNPFGFVQRTLIDKKHWQGLVRFETIEACTRAYADMHRKDLLGKRLLVSSINRCLNNIF